MMRYIIYFSFLLLVELAYLAFANRCSISDTVSFRSSHSTNVIRGGGIIFLVALWLWSVQSGGDSYPWMLAAVTLAAGVSFTDDIHSVSPLFRLATQFVSMIILFYQLYLTGEFHVFSGNNLLLDIVLIGVLLVFFVGFTNIYNFMDGINGILAGYSLSVLIPLALVNSKISFIDQDLLIIMILAVLVFAIFNFRPKDRAKCLSGDVGSVGIALILIFIVCLLICKTGYWSWLLFFIVYAVDGILTMGHRILLRENLLTVHRKHAYQLMANEWGMGHLRVSLIYAALQFIISICLIFLVPDTRIAHYAYFTIILILLCGTYVLFMRKYYHLHKEYLDSLKK